MPNNTVLNEIITNRSANNLVRATVQMRIKRAVSPELSQQVKEVVESIADISGAPTPVVTPEGIFEGIARLRIDFWVPTGKKVEITAALMQALHASFPDANLKVLS